MAARKVHGENSPDGIGRITVSEAVDPDEPYFGDPLVPYKLNLDAPPHMPQIDKIVNKLINPEGRDRVPGVVVAVRNDTEIVHLKGYGYANLETRTKMKLDTIFDLGSLSKQFTALAVMYLAHFEKKIHLSDHLSKFFKEFPRYADKITIEDLLHHTSGLPRYIDIYAAKRLAEEDWYERANQTRNDWYPRMPAGKKDFTNKDVLRWIASQTLLPREPETRMEYSNSGYVVLAELVKKVNRKRFASLLKERFFGPFGMKHTYLFDEVSDFAGDAPEVVNHARCYNHVSGQGFVPVGYTPMNFITGDGNVHSTIVDMAIWENLLNKLDDLSVHPDSGGIREILWRPVKIKNRKHVNYGWGWNLLRDKYQVKVKGVTRKYESCAEYHRGGGVGGAGQGRRAAHPLVRAAPYRASGRAIP
jgi:CubicO group peptidase (beta-lactamase class C family)